VPEATDIRYLTQDEFDCVIRDGIPDDDWGVLERPLYISWQP
jgi:hypothetical protein